MEWNGQHKMERAKIGIGLIYDDQKMVHLERVTKVTWVRSDWRRNSL